MIKTFKKLAAGFLAAVTLPVLAFVPLAVAAGPQTVSPSNLQGWSLNPDPTNATPYEFTEDKFSTGEGSLYVEPIGATPAHKFIAAKNIGTPVSDFTSVSYDFLIAGNGEADDANQFYLNIYANLAGSSTFYDCRYDYVPSIGSTANFTNATFNATDTPTNFADRPLDGFICPPTLSGMPEGSTIKFIALNVGDKSLSDVGIAGYLDNVVITSASGVTLYDFEKDPVTLANKEACKNGGWMTSEAPVYKNQGDCVSSFASQGKARGNPAPNTD